jgi:uroporphyrinogen decarboxylase
MKARENVKRAVEGKEPSKVPLYYVNAHLERSDILMTGFYPASDFIPDIQGRTEWGYRWHSLNDTMGQVDHCPLQDSWDLLETYRAPDPARPERFRHLADFIGANRDRYLIGGMGITGFNQATFLRGFENFLEDLYLEPEKADRLLDLVFEFEEGIIREYARTDLDAISFFDDWGTQQTLMIHPDLWRKVFKPRYKRQFDMIHDCGKQVFFHCCGQISNILPDLIEIGADILNLNQPELFGIEKLGSQYGGKVCFNCPVDHQTVALTGSREEIFDYVRRLVSHLGQTGGRFIGNIEEYHSCGMTEERYRNIEEAFESLNI